MQNFLMITTLIQKALTRGNDNDRVMRVNMILSKLPYPGSIVEIGAGIGTLTAPLLGHGRRVIVVDPFEDGWDSMPESYGKPYPFKMFEDNVGCPSHLTIYKHSSQDAGVGDFLKQHGPLAFAFVDGLQFVEAVLSDLRLVAGLEVPVIAVDDIHRNSDISQVPQAVVKFLLGSGYQLFTSQNSREGYLVIS